MDPLSQLFTDNFDQVSFGSLSTPAQVDDPDQWGGVLETAVAGPGPDTTTYASVPSNVDYSGLRSEVDELRGRLDEVHQRLALYQDESSAHMRISDKTLESTIKKVKHLEDRIIRHHGPSDPVSTPAPTPNPSPASPFPPANPTQVRLPQDRSSPIRTDHGIMFSATASRPLSQPTNDSETQSIDDDQLHVLALSLDVNLDVPGFVSQCRARSTSSTPQTHDLSPSVAEHVRQLKTIKKDYLVELIMELFCLRVDLHVLVPKGQNEAQPNVVLQLANAKTSSASTQRETPAPDTPLAQTATSTPIPSSSHLAVPNNQRAGLPTPSRTASPSTPSTHPSMLAALPGLLPSSFATPTPSPSQTIPNNSMSKRGPFPFAGVSAPKPDPLQIPQQSVQGRKKSKTQSASSTPTSIQALATGVTQSKARQKRKAPDSDTLTTVIPSSAGQLQQHFLPPTHVGQIQSYAPSNMTLGMAQNAVSSFYGMQQQQFMNPPTHAVSRQYLAPPQGQTHMLAPAFEGPPQKRQRYDPGLQHPNYGGPSSS